MRDLSFLLLRLTESRPARVHKTTGVFLSMENHLSSLKFREFGMEQHLRNFWKREQLRDLHPNFRKFHTKNFLSN